VRVVGVVRVVTRWPSSASLLRLLLLVLLIIAVLWYVGSSVWRVRRHDGAVAVLVVLAPGHAARAQSRVAAAVGGDGARCNRVWLHRHRRRRDGLAVRAEVLDFADRLGRSSDLQKKTKRNMKEERNFSGSTLDLG
jgi:hypothetical protein